MVYNKNSSVVPRWQTCSSTSAAGERLQVTRRPCLDLKLQAGRHGTALTFHAAAPDDSSDGRRQRRARHDLPAGEHKTHAHAAGSSLRRGNTQQSSSPSARFHVPDEELLVDSIANRGQEPLIVRERQARHTAAPHSHMNTTKHANAEVSPFVLHDLEAALALLVVEHNDIGVVTALRRRDQRSLQESKSTRWTSIQLAPHRFGNAETRDGSIVARQEGLIRGVVDAGHNDVGTRHRDELVVRWVQPQRASQVAFEANQVRQRERRNPWNVDSSSGRSNLLLFQGL